MGKCIKIKFCGLKQQAEVDFCTDYGVSYIGFVFYDKSPRNISTREFSLLKLQNAPPVVAVFFNPTLEYIQSVVSCNRVDFLQIHGINIDDLAIQFIGKYKLIKPLTGMDFTTEEINQYNFYDYLLFDSQNAGSGDARDFSFAQNLQKSKPFFLAGGINITNVQEPLKYTNYIDLSSGIENIKGQKSLIKMKEFIKALPKDT